MGKRSTLFLIAISLILVSTAAFIFLYPINKEISNTIEGIQYQLQGDEVIPVTININGKLQYSLLGNKRFKGVISVKLDGQLDSKNNRELNMSFQNSGKALMSFFMDYADLSEKEKWNTQFGRVFFSKDFKLATFEVIGLNDRVLIAGPAKNKMEGLQISQELMYTYLNKYNLNDYFKK
ncbi:hypothetical protein [Paenibacillus rhizolycopersici]|uniref:hypothetical protein n=1 Tax=Paenibacillus rhizolycopersici TaxID=2780073 RepID=UPI003D29D618